MVALQIWCLSVLSALSKVEAERSHFDHRTQTGGQTDRLGKLLPVFQVVRFPNDPCEIEGGSKNGTCYTAEECSNLGGTNGGSCASGFGVCCIIILTCGSTSSENCTYFEVSSPLAGSCRAMICRANSDVCSIRLDFNTFVISGPNTNTASDVHLLGGSVVAVPAGVKTFAQTGRCITDRFTITNQFTIPELCGTVSGHHIYFEASSTCNSLDFTLGSQPVGLTALATRTWSIKVTQVSCSNTNLPPRGCDQWYMGTLGTFESFNYGSSSKHLANQHQTVCFRREMNYCQICFSADNVADVSIGGFKTTSLKAAIKGSICCAYGSKGENKGTTGAYDCIMIPGATKAANDGRLANSMCANKVGLATASGTTGDKTICSRSYPFRLEFFSDGYENVQAAMGESLNVAGSQNGFKLRWFQTATNC